MERRSDLLRGFVVVLVGAAVWTAGALRRSLWEDEFHSLHHIRGEDLRTCLELVRSDNHPPLSFLLERASVSLFGETQIALRLPTLLVALAFLLLFLRFCRRLPDARARSLAPWLVVLSSYVYIIFSEARMYALLALSTLGLIESVLRVFEGRGSRWWVAFWMAVGLHSHYYFLHDILVMAALVAAVGWRRSERRAAASSLALPALLGVALFLPWLVYGPVHQLSAGLAPGGTYRSLWAWCQSLAHLLYMNASLAGALVTYGIAMPGAAVAAALGVLGVRRLWSRDAGTGSRLLLLLLLGLGLVAPLWAFSVSHFFSHASYNWRYISGSTAPVLVLIAAGMGSLRGIPGFLASAIVLVTMLVVIAVNLALPAREDYRGTVAYILQHARPGDAVVTKPIWPQDPERSPTGWDFYRTRLDRPAQAHEPVEIPIAEYRRAGDHPRVWAFLRYRRYPAHVLQFLRESFAAEETRAIGPVLDVHLFSQPRAGEPPREH